jgi:signal transduction histidine kinase
MTDDFRESSHTTRYDFAALIEMDRPKILADYVNALDAVGSSVVRDPVARQQTVAHASQSLSDIVASVRAGRVQIDENSTLLAWEIGETRAANAIPTQESWRAAMVFVETVVSSVMQHVNAESLDVFGIVLLTLSQSTTLRIREATGAYTSYLLNRIHEAHVAERRRIARELHDRVGNGLSVAHRQLELFQDYHDKVPVEGMTRAERAHQAVVESMESLRGVISDLRLEVPLKSLEKALASYVESVSADNVTLRLRVNGDETWVPSTVRDESFLVIREAIRNALTHGAPGMVLISVDIAPHELRAVIEDTGRGFDQAEALAAGATGLSSMRERAALLGGTLSVLSHPSQGTQVELVVPLPEQREDAARSADAP